MCRVVGAGTSFQMVMHEKLQQTFRQKSFVGCCVHTGDCDGQNAPASSPVPVLIQCCRWSLIVAGWHLMLWHTQSNCKLAWNEQWSGIVGLCPFPTSSVQLFGWDWVGGSRGGSLSFGSGYNEMHNFTIMTSQHIGVHERHCVFYFAQNIVFKHKINFCVAVESMVYFPCVWLCFIWVSVEFTLD